jgi:DNA/RNA-binding domain of Phe-tRNA-synthetase-like protein
MTEHGSGHLPTLPLTIDAELSGKIRVASFVLEPVTAGPRPASLDADLDALQARYRALWVEPADAHEAEKPARKLYHALGIDPSKTRPSSEALLRRILQGKGLYRVNAVVDAANFASLSLLLPVGLYDTSKIHPPVTLRFGRAGEGYEGIRKDRVNLDGRPVLVDEQGPFGNPTSDSLRTCVTETTRSVWFVLFAPAGEPEATLHDDLVRAHRILQSHAGQED